MSGLVLRNVTKTFGSTTAVDSLNLEVGAQDFVSILGPSGCGKTTLLRMLAGLERPDSGEILIGEKVVNDLPPARRDIAMVFQTYALYPHMTVAGNIEYPLRKRGFPRKQRLEKLTKAAELLQLGDLLRRKPRELSGGQQQRVALGRAMVRDPENLFAG
jgi:multiple sugar transport system ATP-binding protein